MAFQGIRWPRDNLKTLRIVLNLRWRANFKIVSVLNDDAAEQSGRPDSIDQRKRCDLVNAKVPPDFPDQP
ncbi:hypothetical protein [Paraburkholderia caribensis]|uniref:hypothetical protein n=1 Tax=Paraburkholderia caribensis TaxID=75105 RepID=UPI0031DC0300